MTGWGWLVVTLLVGALFTELSRIRGALKEIRDGLLSTRPASQAAGIALDEIQRDVHAMRMKAAPDVALHDWAAENAMWAAAAAERKEKSETAG
jgi:hypothetical protein